MELIAYIAAALLWLLGLVFVVGVVLFLAGGAMIALARLRPKVEEKKVTIVQKIDLSGDVHAEALKCKQCGAELDEKSVTVRAGAVFVNCGYCGSSYQIEEAPKW